MLKKLESYLHIVDEVNRLIKTVSKEKESLSVTKNVQSRHCSLEYLSSL